MRVKQQNPTLVDFGSRSGATSAAEPEEVCYEEDTELSACQLPEASATPTATPLLNPEGIAMQLNSSEEHPKQPVPDMLQFRCHLCTRGFRFEKNRLRHLHKAHAIGDQESVLKCKLCAYTTRHYSNMYVHIRTHTGDKPYWCNACGASFTQGSSLKLHIRSRHQDNMGYFSLNKKLGKNNLTKLWQRVLKKDMTDCLIGLQQPAAPLQAAASHSQLNAYQLHHPAAAACSLQLPPMLPFLMGHSSPQLRSQGFAAPTVCDSATMTEAPDWPIDHQSQQLAVENARLRLELRIVKQNAVRLLSAALPHLPLDPEVVARFLLVQQPAIC